MLDIVIIMMATMFIFTFGIVIGYRLKSGYKPVAMPKLEEIKKQIPLTKEHKLNKKEQEEIEMLNKKLHNINIYDGTSKGQVRLEK